MKGLFRYEYDYHEWEILICVGHLEKVLIERGYQELRKEGGWDIVLGSEDFIEHEDLRDRELTHYMVREVEFI